MKIVEDAEEETMYIGADVDALNAACSIYHQSSSSSNQTTEHHQLTSYPMYGANIAHPYSIGASSTSLKPQNQDSQITFHQGILPTQSGGTAQPMSSTSVENCERHSSSNEPNRLQGGSFSHLSTPHNQFPWQSSVGMDKVCGSLASVPYTKQEVPGQTEEQHSPIPVCTQVAYATALVGQGTNLKRPLKNPSIGQKKPLGVIGTPSSLATKKQKVSGTFQGQSIDQLNDVTAVSGVNLRGVDIKSSRHQTIVSSDVIHQILVMNRKVKDDWEKKQADEDETMDSGADVEALSAAFQDVEGHRNTNPTNSNNNDNISFCSTPQPSSLQSDQTVGVLSRGSYSTSNQLVTRWQESNQEDLNIENTDSKEKTSQSQEQTSPDAETAQHRSYSENQEQPLGYLRNHSPLTLQLKDDQLKRRDEPNPLQYSKRGGRHDSEHNLIEFGEQDTIHPQKQHKYAKLQEINNQQVPAAEPENRNKLCAFVPVLSVMLPHLDKDRCMQLQTLYNKLKKNKIPKDGFVRHKKSTVGVQMLRQAILKMQQSNARATENSLTISPQLQTQSQTSQQQHQIKMPSHSTSQCTDTNPFSRLHRNGHRAPTDPTQAPTVAIDVKSDYSFLATKCNAQKRESEYWSDSHSQGLHANHVSSTNVVNLDRDLPTIQGPTKREREHVHHQLTSYPMYGANIAHPYLIGASSTSLKPQKHDSQITQVPFHQGILPTQSGGTAQPMSSTSIENCERHSSSIEPNRLWGRSFSHLSTPHNQFPWQSSVGMDKVQTKEQHSSQFSSSSSSTFCSGKNNHGNLVAPGTNSTPVSLPVQLDSPMPDYGIDFKDKAFWFQCGSELNQDMRQSEDVSEDGYGTTNIISILGGVIIVAVDSRITSNSKLKTDYHQKLIQYDHDIFGTMCGGRKISKDLRDYLETSIRDNERVSYTVQDVPKLASRWLINETKEARKEVGDKPPTKGKKPPKKNKVKYRQWEIENPEFTSWEKKHKHWFQQYASTASFIFGFQSKTPKVYIVSGMYEVPADISKSFTLEQYIKGITREMDKSVVSLTSFPHHHVLGSSRPIMRGYIDKSEYFKGLKIDCDIARMSNEEKTYGRERDFAVDAIEYAKAITYASMNDLYTGGHIVVKMVSKGTSINHEVNTAEIYLRRFHELESTRVLVFAIKAIGFQRWMVDPLKAFLKGHGCVDIFFRLGNFNDYCFFRLPLMTGPNDLFTRISLDKERADFGLPLILRVDHLSWLVFEPTVEAIKPFLVF